MVARFSDEEVRAVEKLRKVVESKKGDEGDASEGMPEYRPLPGAGENQAVIIQKRAKPNAGAKPESSRVSSDEDLD